MILFHIWCVSIAADEFKYIVAAANEAEAAKTIKPWYRQDYIVRPATLDEAIDIGDAMCVGGDVVRFNNDFYEFCVDTGFMRYINSAKCQCNPARCNGYQGHCNMCLHE